MSAAAPPAAPAQPPQPVHPVHPVHRPLLSALILLLVIIDYLQSGMIAFAAGPIMGEIGASPEQFSLVVAAYAAVAILVISQQRWLVERLGWRRYVATSLLLFSAGALVCHGSHTLAQFCAGRLVMALGGAAFVTAARVLINLLAPGPLRFKGIWYYATGLTIGSACAPLLAAEAVTRDTWAALFLVLVVLALLAGVVSSICLAPITVPQQKTDASPALVVVLAGASFALLYAFQRAAYDFYSQGTWLVLAALAGLLALAWFVRRLARRQRPLLDVRALRGKRFLAGMGLYGGFYVVFGANNYALPVLLQRGLNLPWEVIGRLETIALLPSLLAWWITARVLPHWPAAGKFFGIGFAALTLYAWGLSRLTAQADALHDVLPALMCNGIFIAMVLLMAAVQTFKDVQHDDALFSHAQQVKNMLAQLGLASGTALASVGLQWRIAHHYSTLNGNFMPGNAVYEQSLQGLGAAYQALGAPAPQAALANLGQALLQQSTLLAALDYFSLIAVIGVLAGILMTTQKTLK